MQLESSLVKGTVADSIGQFYFDHVTQGYYLIAASMVGYLKFYSEEILVKDRNIIPPDFFDYSFLRKLTKNLFSVRDPV